MKTLKSTLTLFPAIFLLFFWIGTTGNLSLTHAEIIAWPAALAATSAFSIARFFQTLK